jgi:hypothetical protein
MLHQVIRKLRSRRPLALALGLLAAAAVQALSGCAAVTSSGSLNPPASTPPPAGTISVCNQTPSGCSSESSYSLPTVRDLSVTVNWSHVPEGTHTQTLEFLDPKGGLFEVRTVAFSVDSADSNAQTNVLIPISGTFITKRRITGQWGVRVSLDGQSAQTQTVVFQP